MGVGEGDGGNRNGCEPDGGGCIGVESVIEELLREWVRRARVSDSSVISSGRGGSSIFANNSSVDLDMGIAS